MEVGLVGVAALRRHQGGAVTRGEAVGGVVEADELGGALGGEADLGSEPGPQSLAAPSGLGCQPFDPNPPRSEEHTSELQSRRENVCRLLLEKKKKRLLNLLLRQEKCLVSLNPQRLASI